MYKVYLLKSLTDKEKSYVGLTIKAIDERLKEHNEGLSLDIPNHLDLGNWYITKHFIAEFAQNKERNF